MAVVSQAQLVTGPTVLLTYAGVWMLTDPTFSGPGEYPSSSGAVLTKLRGPAVSPQDLPEVGLVLLSHHQHPDNLDPAGEELIAGLPRVLSTTAAAQHLGDRVPGIHGMEPWDAVTADRPDGAGKITITAVPARHGPAGTEHLTGPVIGFVLTTPGEPTVYISGDNAAPVAVKQVAARFGVDVALLHGGAARSTLAGGAYLTLTAEQMVQAARDLDPGRVYEIHAADWGHLTQDPDRYREAFAAAGWEDRFSVPEPGDWFELAGRR